MNIYVEYDAQTLQSLGLTGDPACEAVIFKRGEPQNVLASVHHGNPLDDGWLQTQLHKQIWDPQMRGV